MASTKLSVTNNSDIPIKAQLIWGASDIGSADIKPKNSGSIPCEYVWYDLRIFNTNINTQIGMQNGVYGESSWLFAGTVKEGYNLLKQ
jgi:hypothetical protein